MSLCQVGEIGSHAVWALVDRWHVDEQAATAAMHDVADELGVAVPDLAALVLAGAPHLHAVADASSDTARRESGQRTLYGRRERPLVEVRVDGSWHLGRLCNQIKRANGWWLYVDYRRPENGAPRLAKFAEQDVRRVTGLPPGAPSNPGPNGPDEPPPDNPSKASSSGIASSTQSAQTLRIPEDN